jgi:hypothetical protein
MNTTEAHRERDRERNAIRDQLEPGARGAAYLGYESTHIEALVSIAISLKRLADSFDATVNPIPFPKDR